MPFAPRPDARRLGIVRAVHHRLRLPREGRKQSTIASCEAKCSMWSNSMFVMTAISGA
jgi:hypothetical protein